MSHDFIKRKQPQRQRGAAILIAMLVVTLVATLAAGLQWRQWRMLQTEAAARAQSQAGWVLVGALDWARLILREDARSADNNGLMDHLGEPWALPLQEVKLASFLTTESLRDASQETVYLSGRITDAQSKINLTNLIFNEAGQAVSPSSTYSSLVRLYQQLSLPPEELKQWAARWQAKSDGALRPMRIEQLTWLGVPSDSAEVLKNYLTILPSQTPINLNTASAAVIFASVSNIDMATAQKLVAARARAPIQTLSEASNMMSLGATLQERDFSVSSQYFEAHGRLRLDDWVMAEESLVRREGLNVTTVWRRRR